MRWTFNLGGAVDDQLARRRAGMELRVQRSGGLGALETDGVGPGFYKFAGVCLMAAGPVLFAISVLFMFL
ncbi:hypothetical protein ACIPJS_17205 [Streptomyces sp. NPDC086783]|uniref:hypothetical protein n=1 Tax=Streptomyces sp. NPDC086783 TaxID=3365758 RepID=UPI0037FFE50C